MQAPQVDHALVNLTSLVVCHNEAHLLERCLSSLRSSGELIVVDLGSSDGSAQIAEDLGATVSRRAPAPFVEQVLGDAVAAARGPWVLRIDPDEMVPEELVKGLAGYLDDPEVGLVEVPMRYHFKGRPLEVSVWGGVRYLPRLIHKDRVRVSATLHMKPECLPGWSTQRIRSTDSNEIRHDWADGYRALMAKHRRYVSLEGAERYGNGERFSWRLWVKSIVRATVTSLSTRGGWRSLRGWGLGFVYVVYVHQSLWSLRRHERQN